MPTRIGRVSAKEYHSVDFAGADITYKVIETPCTDETTNVALVEDATDTRPFGFLWNAYAKFRINGEVIGAIWSDDYDSAYQFFKYCVGKTVIVIKKERQGIPNVC